MCAGRRGTPWQAPLLIGQALILWVLYYARAYSQHLHPSQASMAQGELGVLSRRWKAYEPQLCYPIDGEEQPRLFAVPHASMPSCCEGRQL
jgi:hypothetical protein